MASPSQSPSPRRLSKFRRNKDVINDSTNTLASSSNSDDATLEAIRTPPTDGTTSKFRDVFKRKSVDVKPLPDSPDDGRRLSNFRLGRKNKLNSTASNDLSRHLSVDSESGTPELAGNSSASSLLLDLEGSGGNSILTDDGSDQEG